ncbi:MAG: NAD/NADP octopine/nopaline dehydrogenase family protein [Gemmataceae bacterium]|nr:NAD/NADP octopine/nopaline dehydrogenase family protein [Gemmataceae bacterium]
MLDILQQNVPSISDTTNPRVRFSRQMFTRRSARAKARPCSVAILGAGHGGLALAAFLAQQGHRVALWNRSSERVACVAELGGVRLTSAGAEEVLAPIALATSHIAAAVADARLILVAVPAFAHADIARQCAPHLRDGQSVLLMPGRTGGALEFRRVLREAGCRARILLGEANTFPLAARNTGPASAVIFGTKSEVLAAALPAVRTPDLLAAWQPLLPMLTAARSVLHTSLTNVGAMLHPVITLLNADRIQRGDSFDFYAEGVTPAVAATLAAADAERLAIARAYGVPVCSLTDWIASAYGHHADTMQAAVGGNPAYKGIKAPTKIEHRYLLEDVPTGLIPLIELAAAAGIATPTLRSLVERARTALGREAWQEPRTLKSLGLEGRDVAGIRALVEGGSMQTSPATAGSIPFPRFNSELALVPHMLSAG